MYREESDRVHSTTPVRHPHKRNRMPGNLVANDLVNTLGSSHFHSQIRKSRGKISSHSGCFQRLGEQFVMLQVTRKVACFCPDTVTLYGYVFLEFLREFPSV